MCVQIRWLFAFPIMHFTIIMQSQNWKAFRFRQMILLQSEWSWCCPGGGALNFGLHAMCHQKDPTFFRSLSPKDPHFYQLSPNDPLFLTNSLPPKDPDTSLSLKDHSFSNWIVKQVTISGKKMGFLTNLTKVEKFLAILLWKPLFFSCISLKDPLFLCACHWKTPFFDPICYRKTLHLRCLVALVRHFHMWVPPPRGCCMLVCSWNKRKWTCSHHSLFYNDLSDGSIYPLTQNEIGMHGILNFG